MPWFLVGLDLDVGPGLLAEDSPEQMPAVLRQLGW
jgi:hypothetical protein